MGRHTFDVAQRQAEGQDDKPSPRPLFVLAHKVPEGYEDDPSVAFLSGDIEAAVSDALGNGNGGVDLEPVSCNQSGRFGTLRFRVREWPRLTRLRS
jgi:hypothetical protein